MRYVTRECLCNQERATIPHSQTQITQTKRGCPVPCVLCKGRACARCPILASSQPNRHRRQVLRTSSEDRAPSPARREPALSHRIANVGQLTTNHCRVPILARSLRKGGIPRTQHHHEVEGVPATAPNRQTLKAGPPGCPVSRALAGAGETTQGWPTHPRSLRLSGIAMLPNTSTNLSRGGYNSRVAHSIALFAIEWGSLRKDEIPTSVLTLQLCDLPKKPISQKSCAPCIATRSSAAW